MAQNDLPALSAPRLPWHPVFRDEFGIDEPSWRAVIDAIFPAARSIDSIRLALSYCKARHLDVFKRPINIVPIWSASQRKYVETIWPGIGELRTTAMRTGAYAGCDDVIFGEDREATFVERVENERRQIEDIEHKVVYPTWAQMTVYRLDRTTTARAVRGPRVLWMETYSRIGRTDCPNERWRRAPLQMLEKCAEAAALRRAFPEELGDSYIDDEAGARAMVDVTPSGPPPASPGSPEAGSSPPPSSSPGNAGLRDRLREALHAERPSSPANVEKVVGDTNDMLDELERRAGVQKSPAQPQEGASPSEASRHVESGDSPSPGSAEGQDPAAGSVPPSGSPVPDAEGEAAAPGSEFEVIVPIKRGRSFDWGDYAERYIAAGLQVPVARLGVWRGKQASMFEGLHQAYPGEWARANQALAEYERERKK